MHHLSSESWWHDARKRAYLYQILALVIVVLIGFYFVSNTQKNLEKQNIASGFSFLEKEASFEIGEHLISYSSADTYLRALTVGLLNTIKVSIIGIIISLFLGVLIGIGRLSANYLVKLLSTWFVELTRNLPLLLQLFFWYGVLSIALPGVREAYELLPYMFLSNRGLVFPAFYEHPVYSGMIVSFVVSIIALYFFKRWTQKKQDETGKIYPFWTISLFIITLPALLVWIIGGAPWSVDYPRVQGFNFTGGVTLSPEFLALTLGLTLYTSGFIAEIVRAGIESIHKGQVEAANSLGLGRGKVLRLVILPQAMRVIIPPLTGQFLNLTKNSSPAVAIGYPDFVSVANTTMNQTGQAIESVLLIMAVYLTLSLTTSLVMNWYNERVRLVER